MVGVLKITRVGKIGLWAAWRLKYAAASFLTALAVHAIYVCRNDLYEHF